MLTKESDLFRRSGICLGNLFLRFYEFNKKLQKFDFYMQLVDKKYYHLKKSTFKLKSINV